MRKFKAKRDYFPDRTFSVWYDENDAPLGIVGVEPPNLNNEIGKSCIPEGIYILKPFHSPTKIPADVYEFQNTAPRVACLVHVANFALQLEGCMAPGLDFVMMRWDIAKGGDGLIHPAVAASGIALQKIKDLTNYQDFQLEITT